MARKPELKAIAAPIPIRRKLMQSQISVLTTAAQQADAIRANAIALVCAELGLALPTNGQSVSIENGELVIVG